MAKNKKWRDKYEEIDGLGEGGNAKVYRVRCKDSKVEYALKELSAGGREKKSRFVKEIGIIKDNQENICGIVPIIEHSVEEYWYVMPVTESAMYYINRNNVEIIDIVKEIVFLCETLEKFHEKEISHRDIKPSNIHYYEGRFCYADFGLAGLPEDINDFTKSDKGLGAIFTISPEMKRNPKGADGKKADVFSLAKTMWMFLAKDEKGFDGVYDYLDLNHSLHYIDKYKKTHLVEIDELLKDATANNPDFRPNIKEFKKRLLDWIDIYSDEDKSQASDWNFLNKQLFGSPPPGSALWREIEDIVKVLNIIGKVAAYNHMFFPGGGGLDFSYAATADEKNCIKLYDTIGMCYVVKPKVLYFEGFGENYKWNYFLLELDKLSQIIDSDNYSDSEYLVEDIPGHYVSAQYAQYGVYDYETGDPFPDGYQVVCRYIKGKFLIVMKFGPYNRINATYDGRHNDCEVDIFRSYIEELIEKYLKIYDLAKQHPKMESLKDKDIEHRILNLEEFSRNPFKNFYLEKEPDERIKNMHSDKITRDYINKNFNNWNFYDILQNYPLTDSSVIKFIFVFKFPENVVFNPAELIQDIITESIYCICVDGMIREVNSYSDKQCYCVYDRKIAIDLKSKLDKKISGILNKNGLIEFEDYQSCFSIEFVKCGKPKHLFIRKEIEIVMRNADDRYVNQLVIDENGYAKVIQGNDYDCGYLFPVRHELWHCGNKYVGKYSDLSTLEDDYISSLQGWLMFLETGKRQYMDFVYENNNEDELLSEIKKYYL